MGIRGQLLYIRLLAEPRDLVVNIFLGTAKTGMAAERNGLRWLVFELTAAYLRASADRFRSYFRFRIDCSIEMTRG